MIKCFQSLREFAEPFTEIIEAWSRQEKNVCMATRFGGGGRDVGLGGLGAGVLGGGGSVRGAWAMWVGDAMGCACWDRWEVGEGLCNLWLHIGQATAERQM